MTRKSRPTDKQRMDWLSTFRGQLILGDGPAILIGKAIHNQCERTVRQVIDAAMRSEKTQ